MIGMQSLLPSALYSPAPAVRAMPPIATVTFAEGESARVYGIRPEVLTEGILSGDFLWLQCPDRNSLTFCFQIDRKYADPYLLSVDHTRSFQEGVVELWINGEKIAPSAPFAAQGHFEQIDVTQWLREGENALRLVLVQDTGDLSYGVRSIGVMIQFNPFSGKF